MSALTALVAARTLVALGFNPGMPVRPVEDGVVICEPNHPEACAWDLKSAVQLGAAGDFDSETEATLLLEGLLPRGAGDVYAWSNTHTQAETLALLARACVKAVRLETARPASERVSALAHVLALVQAGWCPRGARKPLSDGALVQCQASDKDASEWSLYSAAWVACRGDMSEVWPVLWKLDEVLPGASACLWSEEASRTQDEVVSLVQRALHILEPVQPKPTPTSNPQAAAFWARFGGEP